MSWGTSPLNNEPLAEMGMVPVDSLGHNQPLRRVRLHGAIKSLPDDAED